MDGVEGDLQHERLLDLPDRAEALSRGISEATLSLALANLELQPVVVSRDRAQPEQVQSLDTYLTQRLTSRTIATAKGKSAEHATLLKRIEREYGVPAPILRAMENLKLALRLRLRNGPLEQATAETIAAALDAAVQAVEKS